MNVIYDRSRGVKLSSDLNCLDLNLLEEGEKMITSNAAESAGIAILPATALTSAFFKGADIWMNAHGEILSAAEAVMTDWVRRQQVALDLWSQSLKQICQCRDPVDLIQTQQDWLCDTIRLSASGIRILVGDTTNLTMRLTTGTEKTAGGPADDNLKARKARPEMGGSQPAERAAAA